jgi:hypothetical protein
VLRVSTIDTLIPKGTTVRLVALIPSEWFKSSNVSIVGTTQDRLMTLRVEVGNGAEATLTQRNYRR